MADVNWAQTLLEQAEAKLSRYRSDPNCSVQRIHLAEKEVLDAEASYRATCVAQLKEASALGTRPDKPKRRVL